MIAINLGFVRMDLYVQWFLFDLASAVKLSYFVILIVHIKPIEYSRIAIELSLCLCHKLPHLTQCYTFNS